MRALVLELLCEGPASPSELSARAGVPIGTVSYHVRVLAASEWIELVDTKPVRGALQHIYKATGKASNQLVLLDAVAVRELLAEIDALYDRIQALADASADRAAAPDSDSERVPVRLLTLLHATGSLSPKETD